MALKATLRRAVRQAFLALDDLPRKAAYYISTGAVQRDFDTGEVTQATTAKALDLVLFTSFSAKEKDADPLIEVTHTKVLFPMHDLGGVFPVNTHYLIDDAGQKWQIVRVLTDPGALLAKLECRQS